MSIQRQPPTRKPGLLIDIARVVSVGRDHSTGQAVPRFRDENGRLVAVRPRPRQLRRLANGVLGLAEGLEEADVSRV